MTSLLTIPTMDTLPQWQPATWADYERVRDSVPEGEARLFFNQGWLFVEMGEGIDHARFNALMVLLFFIWFSQRSQQDFDCLHGCLMEKTGERAASPDLMVYVGEGFPKRQADESRYINLDEWRVPDLVGEVGDTAIATDLDEKKQLYAALGVPEYWVVDVKGARVLAFRLQEGRYQQIDVSVVLDGLAISLLSDTLAQINQGMSNGAAAQWFGQQLPQQSASCSLDSRLES